MVAVLQAGLGGGLAAAVGAERRVRFLALIGEAVLHLDGQGAADGVEAEDRVVGHEGQAADRHFRDEVPVDDIAIGLVDADAVLIDGEPLRRSRYRRGDEAAVVEVALEGVAGLVADGNAGEILAERIHQVHRAIMIEIRRGQHRRVRRHLVAIDHAGVGRRRRRGGRRGGRRRGWGPRGCCPRRLGAGGTRWRGGRVAACGLRLPESGVVAITLMSGSVVCACAPSGASRAATASAGCRAQRRPKRREPRSLSRRCCTAKLPAPGQFVPLDIDRLFAPCRRIICQIGPGTLAIGDATARPIRPPASKDCSNSRKPQPIAAFAGRQIW